MLGFQVTRFGVVGVMATSVHTGILILLVELSSVTATVANVIAFLLAFVVSYVGHYYWTYKLEAAHSSTIAQFFIIAIGGLLLNYLIFFIVVDMFGYYYLLALLLVLLIVPAMTYVAQRLWVLRR